MMHSLNMQSQLDILYDRYEDILCRYINVVRNEHVIPFCIKHKLEFSAGMGTWCFFDGDKNLIDLDDEEHKDNEEYQVMHNILDSTMGGKGIPCGAWMDSVGRDVGINDFAE
jgi:hypothetical protein